MRNDNEGLTHTKRRCQYHIAIMPKDKKTDRLWEI